MSYHHLACRFGSNSHQISGREALDNETLHPHAPSIFAREAYDSRPDRPMLAFMPRRLRASR